MDPDRNQVRAGLAEAALQISEAKAQAVLNTIIDCVITIDEAGTILSFNKACELIFGYQPQEVLGQNVRLLMPAPYHGQHDEYIKQYIATGEKKVISCGREVKGRRKDGSVFPIDLSISELRLESGRLFTGVIRDITARKASEEALRLEKVYLELAEKVAGVGHWRIDLVANTIFWSEEVYRIHGVTPADYTPDLETAIDFYHPDDRDLVAKSVEGAIQRQEPFEFELRLVRPDGQIRHVLSKGVYQAGSVGTIRCVFGIFQDVTQKREAALRLQESEERYDVAVRGSSVGLWDWNIRTNALYWSPRFKEIVGVEDEAFVPHLEAFESRLHPEDHHRIMAALEAHLTNGDPYDVEFRLRRADGSYVWIHARGQAVWDENGNATRMAGSADDVSDRKAEEDVRRRFNEILSSSDKSTDIKVQDLLTVALEYLGLEIGIVSRIEGDAYRVEYAEADGAVLTKGDEFDLSDTYCRYTLDNDDITAYECAAECDLAQYPCYKTFKLEAYIGSPLYVNGQFFGTLSFSSFKARRRAFTEQEKSLVSLVAQWIGYEISQRKNLDELIASRELIRRQINDLKLIFNHVPARIWYKDDKNRILRLNRQAAESMGLPVEQAEGADTYELFPEMAKKYHDDDLSVINSGVPKLGIVEAYTPRDGERGWVQTDKVPYTDPETGDRYVFVVSKDVTKERETEEALRLSEQRFALAASGASVGIWDWMDVSSEEEWWSPIFYRLLGYEEGEITPGLSAFQDILHPDDRERTFALVNAHFEEQCPFRLEYRLKHKTKGYRWFLGSGQAQWDGEGRPVRMIGSIMDIHPLKQSKEELEQRALSLERLNRDLDHFAYIASHDLRAPLRGMDNVTQWLEEDLGDAIDEDARKKLQLLRQRVARMNLLLTDILAYSRAGRRDSKPEAVDCQALLAEVTDWITPPEGFKIHTDRPLPVITASRTLLEQVLLNLIANAVKHHDRADGTVRISYERGEASHSLTVEDDGPGIPQKFQQRIFNMFQTLRPRDEVEGSGIGLAIVKRSVEAAGGSVSVRSPLTGERGAAFHITLPISAKHTAIQGGQHKDEQSGHVAVG